MKELMPVLLGVPTTGGTPDAVRPVVANRLVVITGASRGIGREMAERLAATDARVVGIARSQDDLLAVGARIAARGGVFHPIAGDLRDLDWAGETGRRIVAEFGPPEVLISNAGHSIHRPLAAYTDRFHDISRTTGVNYLGAVALALPVLAAMMGAGRGHLLSVSTTSLDLPLPGWSAYTASKAAYDSWLACVAPELRRAGIAVTSVHLPRVATAMSAPTAGHYPLPELSPEQAADVLCRAVARRPRYLVPWYARLGAATKGAAPGLVQSAWERLLALGVRP